MNKVEGFLKLYASNSTKRVYRSSLKHFFHLIYPKGNLSLDEKAEQYFKDKRNYEQDIATFLKFLNSKPPKTISTYLSAIKTFLLENDIELSVKFWKRLGRRRQGRRARTLDKIPSNKEFKAILTHMPIQGKTLYLLLASSGMRIGEALSLELDDINLDDNVINIRGETTKTGEPRRAFFSTESKEYIEEWLRNRDRYLKQAIGRSRYKKKKGDRIFPFGDITARYIWNNALKKSGNGQRDKSTGRRTVHPHVLRKFFRTKLGAVIPVDVVEALMGHEGYLTEVYRKYSVEQLKKFYKQGEQTLQIFGASPSGDELESLKDTITRQQAEIEDQKNRVKALTEAISKQQQEHDALKRKVNHFLSVTDYSREDIDALGEIIQKYFAEKRRADYREAEEEAERAREQWLNNLPEAPQLRGKATKNIENVAQRELTRKVNVSVRNSHLLRATNPLTRTYTDFSS